MSHDSGATASVPTLPAAHLIDAQVQHALEEDLGAGDVTAQLLPADAMAHAHVLSREDAVIAGQAWFDACHHRIDPNTVVTWQVADGERVTPDTVVCTLVGKARSLVSGERSALNFLQTLSGTATVAAQYADALSGTRTRVLDTRKTLPGLRSAQKYAVQCGGAYNHRAGLYDAYLIKENHITAAGGIAAAVHAARTQHPELLLEVEVENLDELDQAIDAGVDRIMLDEFSPESMREAVRRTDGRVPLEVSGSVELSRLPAIAETGVDYVSVGALTKHVRAIDLSMRLEMLPAQR